MENMDDRAQNVVEYYATTNSLKDVERTGWNNWKVNRKRIESDPEHIYGTQQLAIAMWSEFAYDINIERVLAMLSVHETEEIIIGDLTQFQIAKEEKKKIGQEADDEICGILRRGEYVRELIREFDERKTPEAKFAYFCDKLECDLQSKMYDEEGCVDLTQQEDNKTFYDERVQRLLLSGKSFSEMWMEFGRETYPYDENFMFVSSHAEKTNMHESRKLLKEDKRKK